VPHLHCCVTDTNAGEVKRVAFEAFRTNTATAEQEAIVKKILAASTAGSEFGNSLRADGCIDDICVVR